jgi:DNA-binding MarR family transcriptional regulator
LLAAFERHLGKNNLSQGRFLTLIVMNRTPDEVSNPSTLADQVGVKPATMTGLLDGLERKGLVQRVVYSHDRRKVGVLLTDAGRSMLDGILPHYYEQISKLMAGLDETERHQLIVLLGKINQRVGEFV